MPLLDHFRPPVFPTWPWETLHTMWIAALAGHLNTRALPPGYLALTTVNFNGRLEIDVPTIERNGSPAPGESSPGDAPWGPPQATLKMPAVLPDIAEARVFDTEAGNRLVGAIELVSPANKDRPANREAFSAKCANYLFSGIGLLVVDVVSTRLANLHNELVRLLETTDNYVFPENTATYAVSYHAIRSEPGGPAANYIELWPRILTVGEPLPTLPLVLRGGPTVPVDLESPYMEARRLVRL